MESVAGYFFLTSATYIMLIVQCEILVNDIFPETIPVNLEVWKSALHGDTTILKDTFSIQECYWFSLVNWYIVCDKVLSL